MDFRKDLEEYNENKIYYFKTPDGKPYNGNTNFKFVGKNNKIYYTGKTYTKYSQLLEHIPKGYSVNEKHHSTPFTVWGEPNKHLQEDFYTLDPIFGAGQSMDDDYKRNILGYQIKARDNFGKKDVLFTSTDENKVRDLFDNIKRFAPSVRPSGTTQTAESVLQSPINTGTSNLLTQEQSPIQPKNLDQVFQPVKEVPFVDRFKVANKKKIGQRTPSPPPPRRVPFENAITPAAPKTPPLQVAEAASMSRAITPEPNSSRTQEPLKGTMARAFLRENAELLKSKIQELPDNIRKSRTKIAAALSGVLGVSEGSIESTLEKDKGLYKP